jgi:CMP-N,N'-diacetyllegionaminic acid synthase
MNMVALIPARAGSKRCPGKNTRELAGHPLIAYTIAAAMESGVFATVWVCTDSRAVAEAMLRQARARGSSCANQ